MKWSRLPKVGLLAAWALLFSMVSVGAPVVPDANNPEIAIQFARMLPSAHLLQMPIDANVSARAWTNYLNMLDFDHSYFLQSDVDRFATNSAQIGNALLRGDVHLAYDIFAVYQARVRERHAFVANLLAHKFDFSTDESYTWKRKDAPWPRSIEEQDDLWRKRIKNEYLGFIIAREIDAARATNKTTSSSNLTVSVPPQTLHAATLASPGTNTLVSASVVTNPPPPQTADEVISNRYQQFSLIIQDADSEYVFARYLSAVAGAYDPHSEYMSPARVEDFNIDMSLSLCGIGAQLRSEDGAAKIEEIIPGGPAARDTRPIRLQSGDKIIGVGQGDGPVENVLHMPLSQTVRKIRGEKGTRVVLNVISASDPSGASTRLVDLIRAEVKLEEAAATGHVERITLTNGHVRLLGVVRLPEFYGTMQQSPGSHGFRSAAFDVMRILSSMNASNVEGVVLDLRNNGGGSLREAIELASAFVPNGPVVQVREPRQIHVLQVPDTTAALAFRKPMVVLINRASASASEIVAGAFQDYGRAVLVGDPQTHGKGSVQTILPLGDDNALGQLKVTTANYYRINGISTQLKGVRPDIIIPSIFDAMDLGEDKLPNPMPWSCVSSCDYTPVWDLGKWIPTLRAQSAERLTQNPHYGNYCKMVQHLREINTNPAVPLEKQARRKQAAAEAELQRLQNEETKRDHDGLGANDDIILNESLRILSDLIDLSGGAEISWEEKADLRMQMMRMFGIGG